MTDYDGRYAAFETPSSSSVLQRLLGGGGGEEDGEAMAGPPAVDYAVVGVIVITLGLVLVIEVLRQKLDAATSGHSFSKVLVELMYREREFVDYFCYYLCIPSQ